jgi:protein gp37
MSASSIEWLQIPGYKPLVWNPIYGCTKVGQGCKNCYAEAYFSRFWPGTFHNVSLRPEKLQQPLHWKTPSAIFVNSMSDLFHDNVPEQFIYNVLETMLTAPRHRFVVLTKRPERMREIINEYTAGALLPSHIAIGVSIEDQATADTRLPLLADTMAKLRVVSAEPLLGKVEMGPYMPTIDWMIVGGESGKHARPMNPDWARSIRDECVQHDVPLFFKQWGEWCPLSHIDDCEAGKASHRFETDVAVRIGKKKAGDFLDGQQWHQFPKRWARGDV